MGDLRKFMYDNPQGPPTPTPVYENVPRQQPVHNGLAIAAFIIAWIIPPLGFILGCVSVSEAHSHNRNASGLGSWAVALGLLFTTVYIIGIVVAVKSASTPVCDQLNPNWPFC